jgi:vacuolar-type H+-ATPase subunit H
MNKDRRNDVKSLVNKISDTYDELRLILDDEQDYFDNIPENLLSSSRAEDSEEAINIMDDALSNLEDIIDSLSSIF